MTSRPVDPKAFGRRIRERRERMTLTLPDLQALVKEISGGARGSGYGTLQRYETGEEANPRPNIVEAIASALGTSPAWLLFEEGSEEAHHDASAKTDWHARELQAADDALHAAFGSPSLPTGRAVFIHAWGQLRFRGLSATSMTIEDFARAIAAPLGTFEPDGFEATPLSVENWIIQVAPTLASALRDPLEQLRVRRYENQEEAAHDG